MKPDNTEELRKQILKAALVRSSVQRWEKGADEPLEASHQCVVEIGIDDLMQLIEAELTEARKDELKKVGQFVQSHNLNDASKHKWYRYHADRVDELNKGKES